jgi:hypothetical protein
MKIKKIFKYYLLGESLKEIEINRILDKISKKSKLTQKEKTFLSLYNETSKEIEKDYMLLSKFVVCSKIEEILNNNIPIVCNLTDRDGKIGLSIIGIENNEEDSILLLKGDKKHLIKDNFLYNLIYNTKKGGYSLEEHDEYFEKIEANEN